MKVKKWKLNEVHEFTHSIKRRHNDKFITYTNNFLLD